jgi:hypothetical protein
MSRHWREMVRKFPAKLFSPWKFMTTACPSIFLPFQYIIYNIFSSSKNSRDIINLKREYYLIQIVQNKGKANTEK